MRGADGRATGVETAAGRIDADMVVVAAGVWTPQLLETCGLTVPVTPAQGPDRRARALARCVFRRKLSEAGYVAAVEADDAALQIAMVVESTPVRHRAARLQPPARRLRPRGRARRSRARSPAAPRASSRSCNDARALRVYAGLRPLTPDHVPIIGPFAEAPNICVATGHEGAGIGLAPATGELVAAWHTGAPSRDPDRLVLARPLRPGRARRLVIELTVDGEPLHAPAGQSAGRGAARRRPALALRDSPGGAPRGLYCGIGVCQECRVLVDGVVVRSCVTPVAAGMRVTTGLP